MTFNMQTAHHNSSRLWALPAWLYLGFAVEKRVVHDRLHLEMNVEEQRCGLDVANLKITAGTPEDEE